MLSVHRTHAYWLRQRTSQGLLSLRLYHPQAAKEWDLSENRSRMLLTLDVYLDRWVVAVYHEAMIEVWDLFSGLGDWTVHVGTRWDARASHSQRFVCQVRKWLPSLGNVTSSAGVYDERKKAILICLTR